MHSKSNPSSRGLVYHLAAGIHNMSNHKRRGVFGDFERAASVSSRGHAARDDAPNPQVRAD